MTPEEIVSLPLTTGAALMGDEGDEIPPEPAFSEPPPAGEPHGPFILQTTPRPRDLVRTEVEGEIVYEPVGIWLEREHPNLTGSEVERLLVEMGFPKIRAARYGVNRQRALDGTASVLEYPVVQELAHQEGRHVEIKDSFSRAFLDRQRREAKKK